jgi:hypothetical protein
MEGGGEVVGRKVEKVAQPQCREIGREVVNRRFDVGEMEMSE